MAGEVKPRLSPGALYTRLLSEFKQRRPAACDRCKMPLPYLIERPDVVSANWRIGTPAACVHKCDLLITEIAAQLWPQCDLSDPVAVPVREPASQATGSMSSSTTDESSSTAHGPPQRER